MTPKIKKVILLILFLFFFTTIVFAATVFEKEFLVSLFLNSEKDKDTTLQNIALKQTLDPESALGERIEQIRDERATPTKVDDADA